MLSGNLPGSLTAVVQPSWARLVNRQLPMTGHWMLSLAKLAADQGNGS